MCIFPIETPYLLGFWKIHWAEVVWLKWFLRLVSKRKISSKAFKLADLLREWLAFKMKLKRNNLISQMLLFLTSRRRICCWKVRLHFWKDSIPPKNWMNTRLKNVKGMLINFWKRQRCILHLFWVINQLFKSVFLILSNWLDVK